VIIIRYRNLLIYVQRQIDAMLRLYNFVKSYVNNVVVYSSILKEHLRYLNKIFKLFKRIKIVIKSSKIFLDYFIIALLDQKINNLEFIIAKNKLTTIRKLQFSRTLKHLEIYLDKRSYLY